MAIEELGHTGFWVHDLDLMTRFYVEEVGLTLTDRDDDIGIVFLSSRPDVEHHELVLARGRNVPDDAKVTHQVSWRVDSIETVLEYHRKFREHGVKVQQEVTHGNAIGIYFFDPEGNRNEIYLRIDRAVPQPFRKTLNLDLPVPEIMQEMERLLHDGGEPYQPVT
jgi:catechol-2,3-dioxygenase